MSKKGSYPGGHNIKTRWRLYWEQQKARLDAGLDPVPYEPGNKKNRKKAKKNERPRCSDPACSVPVSEEGTFCPAHVPVCSRDGCSLKVHPRSSLCDVHRAMRGL